jgi:hypothetical protein
MVDATYHHLKELYEQLDSEAKEEDMDGVNLRVFRGSIVHAYRTCAIPQSYYSAVRKSLTGMGCITMLRQGARGKASVVVLHKAPELADYEVVKHSDLTPRLDPAILAQRVDDLSKQLGGINIVAAFQNIEERLREVEHRTDKIFQDNNKPAPITRRG